MGITEKLLNIQQALKAPKNQFNKFGGFNYRNCEDILEAVKPLLKENSCVLTLSDEIVNIGDRYYIKATATLKEVCEEDYSKHEISNTAYAREADAKKGMDESQLTGACSSYARKYALNGLFCIDDVKDADATENEPKKASFTQLDMIKKLVGDEKIPKMLEYYNVKALKDLTVEQASEIIARKSKGDKNK